MSGIIGKKVGMTTIFNAEGQAVPCTLIEAGPCVVTQVRTEDKDGYTAIQLGYGEKKEKNTSRSLVGHFKKAGTTPKRKLVEFKEFEKEYSLGETIRVEDVFAEGDFLDVSGNSKGRGFQGVVKRHGFRWSNTRSAQQRSSPWFDWCLFVPITCIQRCSYGWSYGKYSYYNPKLESIKSTYRAKPNCSEWFNPWSEKFLHYIAQIITIPRPQTGIVEYSIK